MWVRTVFVSLVAAGCLTAGLLAARQSPEPRESRLTAFEAHLAMERSSPLGRLRWSELGPSNLGGRANDVAVAERSGRRRLYVGYASAGLWKTDDDGETWQNVFSQAASTAVTRVTVAPSNPDVVWLGTGSFRPALPLAAAGVFRSIDAGSHWQSKGLADAGTITRIVVHPTQPDVVYVAAMGPVAERSDKRGVFKTTDGGATWTRAFYRGVHLGAVDLVMDPFDPRTLFVATEQTGLSSSGATQALGGGAWPGIYRSTDGGATWTEVSAGLPEGRFRTRIGIDVARTRPGTLVAVLTNQKSRNVTPGPLDTEGRPTAANEWIGPEVYRSEDRGDTWKATAGPNGGLRLAIPAASFASQIRVDPRDDKTLYLLGANGFRSTNGGQNFGSFLVGMPANHNALWIDPHRAGMFYDCSDGGLARIEDYGATWRSFPAPAAQLSDLALDLSDPFFAYSAIQGRGSWRLAIEVASDRTVLRARSSERAPGGAATTHAIDPANPNIVYAAAGQLGRGLSRFDLSAGGGRASILPVVPAGEPALRAQALVPITLSPHDPQTVYVGYQYLYRSTERGNEWKRISPDLTGPEPQLVQNVESVTRAISAVAESAKTPGLIYVGTDHGRLHVTSDRGETWADLTRNLPQLRWIGRIVPSAFEDGTVYVTQRTRDVGDFSAHLFRSTDRGRTFRSLAANLPAAPVNVIREDPKTPNVLYVGTDFGVYVSFNSGVDWMVLGAQLPSVPVTDLRIHPRDDLIVIATYGRGLWALDARKVREHR